MSSEEELVLVAALELVKRHPREYEHLVEVMELRRELGSVEREASKLAVTVDRLDALNPDRISVPPFQTTMRSFEETMRHQQSRIHILEDFIERNDLEVPEGGAADGTSKTRR